jgi:uncharacterized protein YndB with AHSA1/START domain
MGSMQIKLDEYERPHRLAFSISFRTPGRALPRGGRITVRSRARTGCTSLTCGTRRRRLTLSVRR